jgi:hypothetical protein
MYNGGGAEGRRLESPRRGGEERPGGRRSKCFVPLPVEAAPRARYYLPCPKGQAAGEPSIALLPSPSELPSNELSLSLWST